MLPTLFEDKGKNKQENSNQVILNKRPSSGFLKQAKLSLTCSPTSFATEKEKQNVKVERA